MRTPGFGCQAAEAAVKRSEAQIAEPARQRWIIPLPPFSRSVKCRAVALAQADIRQPATLVAASFASKPVPISEMRTPGFGCQARDELGFKDCCGETPQPALETSALPRSP